MKRTLVAAGAALILALPVGADAQSAQRFSVQLSGIGNLLFGDPEIEQNLAFGAPKNGIGGEIQLRYTPSAWSFGAGFQMTVHESEDPQQIPWDEGQEADQDFTLTGIFIEPRYVATASSSWALYVSGRLSFSSIEWTSKGTGFLCDEFSGGQCIHTTEVPFDDSGEATGYTVNAGGGVLVRLSNRVNLDLGGTFGLKDFGELDVVLTDGLGSSTTTQVGSLGQFGNAVLRLGLAIGIGG